MVGLGISGPSNHLRLGALPVVIRFKNWWHHGPSKWVTFLEILFSLEFGEFVLVGFGLVLVCSLGWLVWLVLSLIGETVCWLLCLKVGVFWLVCFGWFVQLSKLRYVYMFFLAFGRIWCTQRTIPRNKLGSPSPVQWCVGCLIRGAQDRLIVKGLVRCHILGVLIAQTSVSFISFTMSILGCPWYLVTRL